MNARRKFAALLLWCMLFGLSGVSLVAQAANREDPSMVKSVSIDIRNFAFAPRTVTIPVGARVTWTNRDDEPHLITSAGSQFAPSHALDTGDSYAVMFAKPGTYAYYCSIHPMMVGTIIVQ
ncbi:cupredoxin domain-containing protein [Dyella sp. 20L07]|uniref:cupredoxin domain-containing protein n=1 Tax=Dyella sp. 20L07 TaxID=3384240 RepID=UPI003D27E613